MGIAPTDHAFLAHWTYSPDEWKMFMRWSKLRRGFLHYFAFRLFPGRAHSVPEIAITPQKVWIGDLVESFRNAEKQLKKIHIRNAKGIKILVITYEKISGSLKELSHIHIPIPNGKLREAMELHENLSAYAW